MNNKFKGVWVHGGVWEYEPFSLLEKHLFQKISDLDNDKGCTAMNTWFADFLGCSKSRVSQLISGFKKEKLISVELKYKGKEVVGRVINVLKGGVLLTKGGVLLTNTPMSYTKDPSLTGSEVSNIVLLNNIVKEYKEREKESLSQISELKTQLKELQAQNETLKAEKGKEEKTSAKKDERQRHSFPSNKAQKSYKVEPTVSHSNPQFPTVTPKTESEQTKPYQVFLANYPFNDWSEKLKQNFLLYCEVKHETSKGRYSPTQMKMRINEIKIALDIHKISEIENIVESAANGNWADFQFKSRIASRNQKQNGKYNNNEKATYTFGQKITNG